MNKPIAIIPAAGRGTRLGASTPKILVNILPQLTVWDVLWGKLKDVAEKVIPVLSPTGVNIFLDHCHIHNQLGIEVAIQEVPLGMGDAIFSSSHLWGNARNILIMWGDQVYVSPETLSRAIERHNSSQGPRITLPLVISPDPYVEYIFDDQGRLYKVAMAREGDKCSSGGYADIGTFILSRDTLEDAWRDYLKLNVRGGNTDEINFLPFLIYLSTEKKWKINKVLVSDINESRGINTPEDLKFFNEIYLKKSETGAQK